MQRKPFRRVGVSVMVSTIALTSPAMAGELAPTTRCLTTQAAVARPFHAAGAAESPTTASPGTPSAHRGHMSMAFGSGVSTLAEPGGGGHVGVDVPLFDNRWWITDGVGVDERAVFSMPLVEGAPERVDLHAQLAAVVSLAPHQRLAPYLTGGTAFGVRVFQARGGGPEDFVFGPMLGFGAELAVADCISLDLRAQATAWLDFEPIAEGEAEGVASDAMALVALRFWL